MTGRERIEQAAKDNGYAVLDMDNESYYFPFIHPCYLKAVFDSAGSMTGASVIRALITPDQVIAYLQQHKETG